MPVYTRSLRPRPSDGLPALRRRAAATAWSMALLAVRGAPGAVWRSFQFTFTTQPRTAAPMYWPGGWPSRSSSPFRTGLSGPLGAVVRGDEGAVSAPVSSVDGHVRRRWHRAAWRAAWRAARSAWRSGAVEVEDPCEQAATSTVTTARPAHIRLTTLLPRADRRALRWRRQRGPMSIRRARGRAAPRRTARGRSKPGRGRGGDARGGGGKRVTGGPGAFRAGDGRRRGRSRRRRARRASRSDGGPAYTSAVRRRWGCTAFPARTSCG